MKTVEVFKIRKSMSLEDRELERSFNKSMSGLADKLPAINKSRKRESENKNRYTILQKASELLQSKKLSLLDVGVIESRLNKSLPLSKAHIAALGLNDLKKGFENLPEKGESQRVEREPDSLSAHSQAGEYEFINISGQTIKVRKAEILRKTGEAVKAGKIDVIEGGIIEYRLNRNGKIPDHVLRYLFE